MSTVIYSPTKADLVNRVRTAVESHEAEYHTSYDENDPAYLEFVQAISTAAKLYKEHRPKDYRLKRLWFFSSTFVIHWYVAEKSTPAQMVFCCYIHGLTVREAWTVLIAWMIVHGRWMSSKNVSEANDLVQKVWQDAQPEIDKRRKRANQKRRERYQKMKQVQFAIDEPKLKLRDRILLELGEQRSTPKKLATDLGATDDAVYCQLRRLVKSGKVERDAWGLYSVKQVPVEVVQ